MLRSSSSPEPAARSSAGRACGVTASRSPSRIRKRIAASRSSSYACVKTATAQGSPNAPNPSTSLKRVSSSVSSGSRSRCVGQRGPSGLGSPRVFSLVRAAGMRRGPGRRAEPRLRTISKATPTRATRTIAASQTIMGGRLGSISDRHLHLQRAPQDAHDVVQRFVERRVRAAGQHAVKFAERERRDARERVRQGLGIAPYRVGGVRALLDRRADQRDEREPGDDRTERRPFEGGTLRREIGEIERPDDPQVWRRRERGTVYARRRDRVEQGLQRRAGGAVFEILRRQRITRQAEFDEQPIERRSQRLTEGVELALNRLVDPDDRVREERAQREDVGDQALKVDLLEIAQGPAQALFGEFQDDGRRRYRGRWDQRDRLRSRITNSASLMFADCSGRIGTARGRAAIAGDAVIALVPVRARDAPLAGSTALSGAATPETLNGRPFARTAKAGIERTRSGCASTTWRAPPSQASCACASITVPSGSGVFTIAAQRTITSTPGAISSRTSPSWCHRSDPPSTSRSATSLTDVLPGM